VKVVADNSLPLRGSLWLWPAVMTHEKQPAPQTITREAFIRLPSSTPVDEGVEHGSSTLDCINSKGLLIITRGGER